MTLSLGFNTSNLGTSNRTGAAILAGSSRSNAGSLNRIYSYLPANKRPGFIMAQASRLYGPGRSAPRRGIS